MNSKTEEAIAIIKKEIKDRIKEEYITSLIKINPSLQEKKDKPQREKIRGLCDHLCLEGFNLKFLFNFQDFYLELEDSLKEELIIPIPIWPNTFVYHIFSEDISHVGWVKEYMYNIDKYKIAVIRTNEFDKLDTLDSIGTLVL